MTLLRLPHLYLVCTFAFMVLEGTACLAAPLIQQAVVVAIQEDDDSDDEEDDDEFEDEADFKNNPWQIDERKLFAAKKFQLSRQFAVKIVQIDNICGLDKKQKLKLKVASKGAVEKALVAFTKQWKQQLQQFGNFNQQNDDDDDKKKKKQKKKKKRFVVNKVEEIDPQVFQMLDTNFMGGVVKPDAANVPMWTRTVKKVLDDEQQKKLDAHFEVLKLAKCNARADSFIANMRSKLALSDSQLEEFDKLVRPGFLKKDIETNWQYDSMATMYLGSKHDKKEMKKLLSEDQNLALKLALKPAEGYAAFFGDNGNVRIGQAVAVQDNVVFALLDRFFTNLGNFADSVENVINGAFQWAR